jgi:prevent-host-death family protein
MEKAMKTTVVGIRDAKIHLSKLVKLVRNGNEVTLTDRGKPVCKIVPITPQSLSFDERIRRLEEQGVIAPASGACMKKLPPPLPLEKGLAQKYLQEERNHGQ